MNKKRIAVGLVAILIASFTLLGINNLRSQSHQIKIKDVQLLERGAELKKLELKYKNLNTQFQKVDESNQAEVERLEKEKADLDAEKKRLELELQAKAQRKEQQRLASVQLRNNAVNAVTGTQTASALSGGMAQCPTWLAQAGIPATATVLELIRRESGCNPHAVNPSSGACGIGQQLPCGKWAGAWNDPIAGLQAMNSYVIGRYGSWENALAWHNANNWY